MCECYQIGGRFIAEDPDCPVHGRDTLPSQIERLESEIADLLDALRGFVEHGTCFDDEDMEKARAAIKKATE